MITLKAEQDVQLKLLQLDYLTYLRGKGGRRKVDRELRGKALSGKWVNLPSKKSLTPIITDIEFRTLLSLLFCFCFVLSPPLRTALAFYFNLQGRGVGVLSGFTLS